MYVYVYVYIHTNILVFIHPHHDWHGDLYGAICVQYVFTFTLIPVFRDILVT